MQEELAFMPGFVNSALTETSDDESSLFGPTGLPKTPKPGKEPPANHNRGSRSRRQTLHVRNLESAAKKAQAPLLYGTIGSHDHIKYTKSNIRNFIKFWRAVRTYMLRWGVLPPIAALIEDTIVERFIASDYAKFGDGKFGDLPLVDIYTIMQAEFRPVNRKNFIDKLKDNVDFEFTSHYRPSSEYFIPFYDALLVYIASFTEVFDILRFKVTAEEEPYLMPRCDNKQGGLIKLFLSKIPYEFGDNILFNLLDQHWKSLPAFFTEFRKSLDVCKAHSESARRLRSLFSGTQYESKKHEQKLQHMQTMRESSPSPEPALEERCDDCDPDELQDAEEVDTMLAAAMYPLRSKDAPQRPRSGTKAAPQGAREQLPCFAKLENGVCNDKQCTYSHNEELLARKRQEKIDKLMKTQAASRGTGGPRAPAPQKFSNLQDAPDDEEYY